MYRDVKSLDPARCQKRVRVRDLNWPTFTQCRRKPVDGGVYCKQHTPIPTDKAVLRYTVSEYFTIKVHRVVKETQTRFWVGRKDPYPMLKPINSFFNTFEEAKATVMHRLASRIKRAQSDLKEAKSLTKTSVHKAYGLEE